MTKNMKNWDKATLLTWIDNLSGYDEDQIKQIKDGINKFNASGDDVWDADKSDLKEGLKIDGLLAKKLAKSISTQREADLGDNLSKGNTNNGNNNSQEIPFTLNIGGSTPTKLKNIKSSMNIGRIKELYLEENAHEVTNEKMKGVNIKYLGEALNDEERTLQSYGIYNGDGMNLFVTYSLNGGMSSNDDEKKTNDEITTDEKTTDLFQIGQEIKCIDKDNPSFGYYPAKVEAVEPDGIEIRWGGEFSHMTQKIPKSEFKSRIEGFEKDNEAAESTNKPANNKVKVDDGSNYHSIPMNKWNGIHTQYWINSLGHPFPNYADKFNKINGVQLMDIGIDDLTVIISSKMIRKKLIKHLNGAKLKYIDIKANDKNESEYDPTINNNNQHINGCIMGLNNLGNTCFLNTCIQVLSHTPKLANYFAKRAKFLQITDDITADDNTKSNGFSLNPLNYWNGWSNKDKNRNNHQNISMLNAWIHLCDKMYNQQSRSYAPTEIISALHQIDNHFGSGAQDDSARAMRFILGKLDEEIENEIFAKKNKGKQQTTGNININEMNRYVINHSNPLNDAEESMVIQELLRRHNPNDSIIRKLFDGVQRELIECVHCKEKFQQYVIFRDLDIPVINNHVSFNNLNIIHNNKHYSIKCKALSHCTIDVLKYEVIKSLKCSDICLDDVHIVTISSDDVSNIKAVHSSTKISELASFSGGSIFALICNKNSIDIDDDKKVNTEHIDASNANILQFVLFVGKNGEISSKFDTQFVNHNVYAFMVNDLKQYQLINGDKYYYQLLFNGVNIDISKLKKYNFKTLSKTDCNSLILLCIDKKNNDFPFYEFDKIDIRSLRESNTKYPNSSPHNALQTYKCDILKSNDSFLVQTLGLLFNDVQKDSKLQLKKIDETLLQLEQKQKLSDSIDIWFNQFQSTSSTIQKLHNLEDCLATYQEKHILDRDSYEYTCRYCKLKCQLIKMERTIVYAAPILIFHLDRFNNKNNVQPSRRMNTYKSKTKFKRNDKVQVFDTTLKKWYDAKIIQTNKNKVKISFDNFSNKYDEWINKDSYPTRIARTSNQSYSHSTYSTNKFRHSVEYKMELCLGKTQHNLFGVANHSGSTSEYGHYTATVKSSRNGCWYNISDTSIDNFGVNALGSTKTATLIMYSNIQ